MCDLKETLFSLLIIMTFSSQSLKRPQRSRPLLMRSRQHLQLQQLRARRTRARQSPQRMERRQKERWRRRKEEGRGRKSEFHQRACVQLWTLRYFTLIALLSVYPYLCWITADCSSHGCGVAFPEDVTCHSHIHQIDIGQMYWSLCPQSWRSAGGDFEGSIINDKFHTCRIVISLFCPLI